MTERVSQSETGQHQPKPTREERDAAFSAGAGRKAVEEEKEARPQHKSGELEAPIGTELETKADELNQ